MTYRRGLLKWFVGLVVLWCDGAVVWWFGGVVVWVFGGLVVWWFGGLVVWWLGGLCVWWFGGLVVWWFGGVVVWWCGGLVVWWRGGVGAWWCGGEEVCDTRIARACVTPGFLIFLSAAPTPSTTPSVEMTLIFFYLSFLLFLFDRYAACWFFFSGRSRHTC